MAVLTADQLLQSIWAALRRIEDNLALPPAPLELPPPQVTVHAPDLTDLTQTLMGLQPGPTALELARAIADVLPPSLAKDAAPSIEMYDAIVRALERLDFRMQAPPSQGYIGGSVNLQPDQTVGINNWAEMPPTSVGTVEVTNDAGNPLPVSGPLTDAQLRVTPVPVSGTVALDSGSLVALENVTVTVGSAVEVNNDAGNPIPVSGIVTANLGTIDGVATEVTLAALLVELGQKLEAGQAVALDSATLAALETITAVVSGTVALDSATLSALETINAVVSGTVAVSNFPASTEIANDSGNPVPISGTVTVSEPVTVDGTVALDSASLAALETVSVANMVPAVETGLAKDATLMRRYGDHVTKAGLASSIGDNTLHTPAAGKKIRLYWIALSTSQDNAAENLIQVKLTDADGAVKYRWRMGNPGAFSGSRTIEGNVDEPLILNLATTDPVDYNIDLEEVT